VGVLWSIGVPEYWGDGKPGDQCFLLKMHAENPWDSNIFSRRYRPTLQYSNTPNSQKLFRAEPINFDPAQRTGFSRLK
jgi:hypothetical protein